MSKEENIKQDENKTTKFDKKTILIIVLVLMLLLSLLFLVFRKKESYTITFDTNGGSENIRIEVENNEIVHLPETPTKEGYTFVGWINKDGKIITTGIKVDKNTTLKAEWISNDVDKVTINFNTDEGNKINHILIEKGKYILLPTDPIKEGYKFVGWFDANDNFVTNDTIINNNITLKAKWVKKGVKTSTVKLKDDDGNTIGSVLIENGNKIVLPLNPTKVGYKFLGWFDEKGNEITKDTVINKNTTIKSTWIELYTCPSDCTRIEDGSKCVKTSTTDLVTYTGCPNGTETIETFCSTHKWQVTVGFGEDQTYETAGVLCSGNPTNYCVDYNSRYTHYGYDCPSGYFKYTYSPSGLDAITGCVKKYDKGGSGCPSGYTKEDNKCIKKETINCTEN